jgi:creatinine amidohydrolase/Fe(II)-dependent formamide hydrolase-like protein
MTSNTHYGFELFYSCGGHGGPYYTMEHAQQEARRRLKGMPTMAFVSIVARDPHGVGGYGQVMQRIRQVDEDPTPNQMAY